MLLFFSCQELVNNDQQRALTSRTPPRESSKSPTRAVSWVNRLFVARPIAPGGNHLGSRLAAPWLHAGQSMRHRGRDDRMDRGITDENVLAEGLGVVRVQRGPGRDEVQPR